PESAAGWLWVPNKDLTLRAVARRGTLHGQTNVPGYERANQEFQDGEAIVCKKKQPIIPMRHECKDGIAGLTGK
ncbi:MAG: hypothetical protein ABEN55_21830, partial [Bradymonadaceae bacterium]